MRQSASGKEISCAAPTKCAHGAIPPRARAPGAPLENATFRSIWLTTQVASLGWLIQTVAISWPMATISTSDVMVASSEQNSFSQFASRHGSVEITCETADTGKQRFAKNE
ncbi:MULTISPECIES: MFS transporter [unclassified Mesorhizobium]|uniref:MFS transporter n=1 Tax=unclassified Mesorhizobium TaxID=325217 RepID=UPI000BAEB2FF|nr:MULTISPECIES: MFS transporter [unclassified Mesorhizobium]PBB22344.1 hypothetical protein CK232_33870 [Mesorhizobium sp. WSM4304]PBB74750.1 hypothetical protein CK227_15845 [Mesorhizobium sp. WSM4308]